MAFIYIVVLFYGAQLVSGLLLSIYPSLRHWTSSQANAWLNTSVYAQFAYILMAEALTIGGVYWFLQRYRAGFAVLGLKRLRWRDVGWGTIAVVIYYILFLVAVVAVSAVWHGLDESAKQELGFDNVSNGLPLVLTFISLVILPPIAEEILMRGFLFGSLRKALPVFWAALLTSIVFASPHILEGTGGKLLWIAGIDTFMLSMVLCYLRERIGTLWPGIFTHAIKNGIAFTALYLTQFIHLNFWM